MQHYQQQQNHHEYHDRPKSEWEKASWFRLMHFGHVLPFVKSMRKKSPEQITIDDLPLLGESEGIEAFKDKLINNYNDYRKQNPYKLPSFAKPFIKTFKKQVLLQFLWEGLFFGLRLAYGWFLYLILQKISDPAVTIKEAFLPAIGLFLVVLGSMYTGQIAFFNCQNIVTQLKASIVSLVYDKINRVSLHSLNMISIGKVVNIVANDINGFEKLFTLFALPLMPFTLGGGIAILWQLFGPYSLIGFGLLFLTFPFQKKLATASAPHRKGKNIITDERVRKENELIEAIRLLKMYAWELIFAKKAKESRQKEIKKLKIIAIIEGAQRAIAFGGIAGSAFIILACYAAGSDENVLNAGKAFAAILMMQFIATYGVFIPTMGIAFMIENSITLQRVINILELPEVQQEKNLAQLKKPNENSIEFQNYNSYWKKPQAYEQFDLLDTKKSLKLRKKQLAAAAQHHPIEQQQQQYLQNRNSSYSRHHCEDENELDQLIPALRNVSLSVRRKEFVAIVGQVGSGKSTLLLSMTCEIPAFDGALRYQGKIAYVEQEPSLFAGTFRDNILFGNPFNEQFYNQIISKCCLLDDLKELLDWDMTEIGERGVTLSGGQKARLALARAVYADADIYLLDDPLSAVDSKIARKLYENVIRGQLSQKTVLLVTHHTHFLKNADRIVVMEDLEIKREITFQELTGVKSRGTANGIFSAIKDHAQHLEEEEENKTNNNQIDPSSQNAENLASKLRQPQSLNPTAQQENMDFLQMQELDEYIPDADEASTQCTSKNGLTDERHQHSTFTNQHSLKSEDFMDGEVTRKTYRTYLKACINDWTGLCLALFLLGTEASNIAYGRIVGLWSEGKIITDVAIPIALVLVLSRFSFFFLKVAIYAKVTLRGSTNLHNSMLDKIAKSYIQYFDTNPVGRILNRFSNDIGVMDRQLPQFMLDVIEGLFYLISLLLAVFVLNPALLIAGVISVFLIYIVMKLVAKSVARARQLELVSRSPMYSFFSMTLSGLICVRSFGKGDLFQREFDAMVNNFMRGNYTFFHTTRFLSLLIDYASSIGVILGISTVIITRDHFEASTLGQAAVYLLLLSENVQYIVRQAITVNLFMSSTARVINYAQKTDIEKLEDIEGDNNDSYADSSAARYKKRQDELSGKSIEFECISMSYRRDTPQVIKNLSFKINPREKVGCIGRTGAGKSSLLQILFRMVQNVSGRVLIDGNDIQSINLQEHRASISIIPQSAVVFSGTVRSNIDPMCYYKGQDEILWGILRDVRLEAKIRALKMGLDTEITDGMKLFSQGERQLLCLARAILRQNDIVVLDEATANLDYETDLHIQRTILNRFKSSTIFTIAHRLSTIAGYDKIMVMEHGRLVEFDAPYKLLVDDTDADNCDITKSNGGYFASMVRSLGPKVAKSIFDACKVHYVKNLKVGIIKL